MVRPTLADIHNLQDTHPPHHIIILSRNIITSHHTIPTPFHPLLSLISPIIPLLLPPLPHFLHPFFHPFPDTSTPHVVVGYPSGGGGGGGAGGGGGGSIASAVRSLASAATTRLSSAHAPGHGLGGDPSPALLKKDLFELFTGELSIDGGGLLAKEQDKKARTGFSLGFGKPAHR